MDNRQVYYQQRGAGLLVVLLMLSVWSLLVLLTMENSLLQRKQHRYYVDYSELRRITREELQYIQQRFGRSHSQDLQHAYAPCFQELPAAENLNLVLLRQSGCGRHTTHADFGFILKPLYTDLCSQLVTEHLSGVDFYQLSLFAATPNERVRYQVQTSFALPHWPYAPCLQRHVLQVSAGQLTFRPLDA